MPSNADLSDEDKQQIIRRKRYRRQVGRIFNATYEEDTLHMGMDFCERFGIRISPLSLDEQSDDKPLFFAPFTGKLVNSHPGDEKGIEDDGSDPERARYSPTEPLWNNVRTLAGILSYFVMRGYSSTFNSEHPPAFWCTEDFRQTGLWYPHEFLDFTNKRWEWQTWSMMVSVTNPDSLRDPTGPIKPLPHVKHCIMNEAEGDERLLRGELLVITQIMVSRLNRAQLRPHSIIPVLVYSIMGPWHVRVLEAYFDGKNLNVRVTKLLDMRDADNELGDTLCRLWWGPARGNTERQSPQLAVE